jgi:hypothetical protein
VWSCETTNLPRRTDKPEPVNLFTHENNYKAANLRRVGSLEKDQPILTRVKTLRHMLVTDSSGFGLLRA